MLFPVTARQLDFGFFGLTINGQHMAHACTLMAPVSRTMASITSCFISRSSEATLTLISSWWFSARSISASTLRSDHAVPAGRPASGYGQGP